MNTGSKTKIEQNCVKKIKFCRQKRNRITTFFYLYPSEKKLFDISIVYKVAILVVDSDFFVFMVFSFFAYLFKVDSYNCNPIACFLSDRLPIGLYFVMFLAIVLSIICSRAVFSTPPVLISSSNTVG